MNAERPAARWSLLLIQLPATPSSVRVSVWRRLREAGAARPLNGVWVLPAAAESITFFEQVVTLVRGRGGSGFAFGFSASAATDDELVQCFRADRAREYEEFQERCDAFLAELAKETGAGKFTFAELEEREQELATLTRWHKKIKSRDYFPDESWGRSVAVVDRCRQRLRDFACSVYAAEGIQSSPDESDPSLETQ